MSMLVMQIMLDMIMDLMERIAWEAATIVEMEGQRTFTSKEILTASRLILCDDKEAVHGSAVLEQNFVRYETIKYTDYCCYVWWEREAVPRAAAQNLPNHPHQA